MPNPPRTASSVVPTMMICAAPLANATAAVVNARNTSMTATATAPVACAAPSSRLPIQISMIMSALLRGSLQKNTGSNAVEAGPAV